MNDNKKLVKLGKFLSLVLRHKPEEIGITLDDNGWANVNELIKKMPNLTMYILEEIVETNNKKRYSFNNDKSKIRANQGHSLDVDVELEEKIPPEVLFHGTAQRNVDAIMNNGLKKMNRQHVHLSVDGDTATNVGQRHGKPVVLQVDTKQMVADGIKFFISKNGVWLTNEVPNKYLQLRY